MVTRDAAVEASIITPQDLRPTGLLMAAVDVLVNRVGEQQRTSVPPSFTFLDCASDTGRCRKCVPLILPDPKT